MNPGHNSTLNCDPGSLFHVELWPGSRFHVELWPRVMIPRWIVTPGLYSTLNCDPNLNFDPGLGSQFNVEFWPGVILQRGFLTRGQNSTWNSDPRIYLLPVELRLKKVSEFNSVIKIQQLRRVIIQRKIHWILTPGRYSIGGQNFILHRPPEELQGSFKYNWELLYVIHTITSMGRFCLDISILVWNRYKCIFHNYLYPL